MEGLICVDKPCGISSFKIVHLVRKATQVKKVGHAGTLDPFASGLLIIGIGKTYTRQLQHYQTMPKEYLMRIVLGIETDTYDSYGTITQQNTLPKLSTEKVQPLITSFIGTYMQTPPRYSAKKLNGQRAYKRARNNETFTMEPSPCTIHNLQLLKIIDAPYPKIDLCLSCSTGTYARSIGYDLGKKLQTSATTINLIRTKIGHYTLSDALQINELTPEHISQNIHTT